MGGSEGGPTKVLEVWGILQKHHVEGRGILFYSLLENTILFSLTNLLVKVNSLRPLFFQYRERRSVNFFKIHTEEQEEKSISDIQVFTLNRGTREDSGSSS